MLAIASLLKTPQIMEIRLHSTTNQVHPPRCQLTIFRQNHNALSPLADPPLTPMQSAWYLNESLIVNLPPGHCHT